jgi:hypothetical protein
MNVLEKIDRLINGGPQMAAPPRLAAAQSESSGNIAGAINSGAFGPPSRNSPMDHCKLAPALPKGLLDGVPWPSVSQTQAFDEDMTSEGYQRPRAAFEALKRLDEPFLRLQDAIAQVTRSQHPAFLKNLEDIARRTAEGDPSVHAQDAWTRDDFEEDARQRLDAFKAELRKIQAQAWQIAEPALLEKSAFASSRADELEETAQLPFAKFATAYVPPMYILSLRKYAVSLANGSRRNAGLPSSMLETI